SESDINCSQNLVSRIFLKLKYITNCGSLCKRARFCFTFNGRGSGSRFLEQFTINNEQVIIIISETINFFTSFLLFIDNYKLKIFFSSLFWRSSKLNMPSLLHRN